MESQSGDSKPKGSTKEMAKIELYVAVEINDDAAAMLDASAVGGAAGTAITLVRNSLTNVAGFRKVNVDVAEVADDAESDADETEDAPEYTEPKMARKPVSDRPTARAHTVPTHKSGTGERPGRPATLHNLRASDGEPVRTFGPRSREVLENQGITVWDVEAGETGPSVRKNTGERVAPQRAGKPAVMKRRG